MRSHVQKDDQSLRGHTPKSRLPTGLPFRCYDVLEASHTRRTSPLLAGFLTELLPPRANQLPDKEFRFASYSDMSELGATSFGDVHCMSPCRGDHLIIRPMPDVWRMVSEDSRATLESFLLIVRTRRVVTAVVGE